MNSTDTHSAGNHFNLEGKNAVVTGGGGVLGRAVCEALVNHGANVAILDLHLEHAQSLAVKLSRATAQVCAFGVDILDKSQLKEVALSLRKQWGHIDLLLNFAGGNQKAATVSDETAFFELPFDALDKVIRLNLQGTILPCQVFGQIMAEQKQGVILNVSSMAAMRPLTKVVGYAAAKAAVSNFTQWLATHMAMEYSPTIRVNAIAPGFFLADQNRQLLVDEKTGELTQRGKTIISHTPMKRFGTPQDLLGTVIWLLSPASEFVTGIVVPIDGGFSAFAGV
jgi:NAD(P)-dependent dehydrogenase (short-subunit alcohol dehydrogenase family)